MKNLLTILLMIASLATNAQQTISFGEKGADGTQAKRYEIARVYIDAANWNNDGTIEVDLYEKYYRGGLKKSYSISYGYGVEPSCFLKEMSGEGQNGFMVKLGSIVTVSGFIRFVPIYLDIKYYSVVNVSLKTNWWTTTNPSSTTQGYLYYNTAITGTNIADFDSDDRVYLSNSAGSTILAGNIGIGTSSPTEKLEVNGKIRAKEIKVETTGWPDYVFQPNYSLLSLPATEKFIKTNGHFPEIPSAKTAENNGIELGEMNKKLLQKIEELTLHLIEKDKQITDDRKQLTMLQSEVDELKQLFKSALGKNKN